MPSVYVIDASAINYVGRQNNAPLIFDALQDLISGQFMCFPDEVLDELKRLAKGEYAYSWTKAVAASRMDRGAAYKHLQAVIYQVPNLVDQDSEYESSVACVLAQARSLAYDGHDVQVVTEDVRDKPTRISLAAACATLNVPWCAVSECLRRHNYNGLL